MDTIQQLAQRIRENVARVIVGKDEVIDLIQIALFCEGHILIEDVPGVGKTTMARAVARSLGCAFRRIQFTPDLLPSDITGINIFNQQSNTFEFRAGPIFGQVILGDEINRATPRTQSAMLEAMQERTVTVDGDTKTLQRPFLVLATQNPIELEGTFPLPEAQLDRFLLKIDVGYPSLDQEEEMLLRYRLSDPLEELAVVADEEEILQAQRQVREVQVEDSLRHYIAQVVRATREHEAVELGASPRGSLALYRTAQAYAAIAGRDFIVPDDIKDMAPYVLTHRLMLDPEARLRGKTARQILKEIVDTVPVPVEG
ncbi:MAG: MoxR family ATPase [Chloroflexia bacterium]|nr:MoxR family ATPase [Chloroflexia bacterium]